MDEAADKLSTRNDPVAWLEKNFYIPETRDDPVAKGRIALVDYQKDVIHEAFARDADGLFKYSIIVWSDIKKSGKSTVAAGINLYRALHSEWGEYYVIANDLKQADSRVAHYIRRGIQLSPELRSVCRMNGYRILLPSGSFIEAIPIDPSGEAGSNADQITFCLDEQTEVLTRAGWKGWEELSDSDMVATRTKSGVFEWQKPKSVYCAPYRGKMYGIAAKTIDMLVTPNHRIYGKFIGGRGIAPGVNGCWKHEFVDKLENRFLEAQDAARTGAYYPVLTSEWPEFDAEDFVIPPTFVRIGKGNGTRWVERQHERKVSAELYAEFMGWYLSEGCSIRKNGETPQGFVIGQSQEKNPKKRARIISLLKEMGFVPHEWSGGINIAVYHSTFGTYLSTLGTSSEKFVPDEVKNLPRHCLQIFLEAFLAGDGYHSGKYGYTTGVRSFRLRDDIIEIAQKCGYSVSSYETQDFRWKNEPIVYYAYIQSKDSFRRRKIEKRNWDTVDYNGMVFCPSTKNGVIYVRRNGTYYWTGNSELWGANEDAKAKMWSEMTLSPTKYGKSFRWVESYAGFAEESDLLYSLYETGVKNGHLLWPDKLYPVTDGEPTPLELYVNPEARMLCLWNTQPRCPWQTKEYYASEQSVLQPNEFLRMHRNQWVSSTETFVPMEWYDACRRDENEWPQWESAGKFIPSRWPVVVSMDAAVSGDTFGMWMGCRHPVISSDVLTLYAKRWVPEKGRKLDFQGTEENPGPERELRRLIKTHNVVEVCYDPYQLHDMATRLKQEGLAWFRAFGQGNERLLCDSQLRDLIRDRRIWHRGEVDLREHLQNADAKIDAEDHKIRIVKRSERLKVDLSVCMAMGSYEVLRLNL